MQLCRAPAAAQRLTLGRGVGAAGPSGRPALAPAPRAGKLNLAPLVDEMAKLNMKPDDQVPRPKVGDTVKIGLAVQEAKGKTRTQTLEGVIIGEHGTGINKTIRFRRVFQGVGIEMMVPVHSPVLQSLQLVRSGRVRRAKLYYLRDRIGKAAKLKEIIKAKEKK